MIAALTTFVGNLYLAAPPTTAPPAPGAGTAVDTAGVQQTPLWADVAVPLAQGLGAILVLAGIFKIVTQSMGGKAQGAFKTAVMTILGGAILFNLGLVFDLIGGGQTVVSKLITSITDLMN